MKKRSKTSIIDLLKLFSGRVLLTVICGIVFIMLSKTICDIIILKAAEMTFENMSGIINMVLLIISNVITFYFTKESNNDKKERSKKEDDEWQVSIKKTK